MEKFGIDVSEHNGIVDWDKLKNVIKFAIIRIGWIGNKNNHTLDKQFIRNYQECKRLNIPIGAYVYNYCSSIETAREGGNWVVDQIKNFDFDLPIYIDMEESSLTKLGRNVLTNIVHAFNDKIEKCGFWAGIYANLNWYENFLNKEELKKRYTTWIAHYTNQTELYKNNYDMWQKSSTGSFYGVAGRFDLNIMYRDLIGDIVTSKKQQQENFNQTVDKKLNTVIADEVYRGQWGDGDTRKRLLEKAGYNYQEIQDIVNEKYYGIKNRNEQVYTVKYGDTLTKIADVFGTTITKLVKDNNISNKNKIQVGQKLVIK